MKRKKTERKGIDREKEKRNINERGRVHETRMDLHKMRKEDKRRKSIGERERNRVKRRVRNKNNSKRKTHRINYNKKKKRR